MFRKIHSNRNPADTLLSELTKVIQVYLQQWETGLVAVLSRHPRGVLVVMVLTIGFSAGLSFTHFTLQRTPRVNSAPSLPASGSSSAPGIEQLLETASALKQTLQLKMLVDSLLAKKQLSRADSAALDQALDRIRTLGRQ